MEEETVPKLLYDSLLKAKSDLEAANKALQHEIKKRNEVISLLNIQIFAIK